MVNTTLSQNSKWKKPTSFIPATLLFPAAALVAFAYIHSEGLLRKINRKSRDEIFNQALLLAWLHGLFPILQDASRPHHALCPFLSSKCQLSRLTWFSLIRSSGRRSQCSSTSFSVIANKTNSHFIFHIISVSVLITQLKTRDATESNEKSALSV